MSAEETTGQVKPSLLRRIRKALNEFTPPPEPRPTPSEKEFAEGHHAVGIIYAATEDPGHDAPGPETLVISADIQGHGFIHRHVPRPLGAGSGHKLVGSSIEFRHTTYDPDYSNDIFVTRWPLEVQEALKPIRYKGPGAVRARIWNILSGFCFVIGCAGVMLTPILLCDLIFGSLAGQRVLADFLPGLHPAIAVAVSVGASPLGFFLSSVCDARRDRSAESSAGKPGAGVRGG